MKRYKKLKLVIVDICCLIIGIAAIVFCIDWYCQHQIELNEISSNNISVAILSEKKEFGDYVELYNPGRFTIELDMLYLSDDKDDLQKLSLQGKKIPANGYLVVGLENTANGNKAFGLRSEGETIYLSDASGNILEEIDFPAQEYDTAYAKIPDGSDVWKIASCTPGRTNLESYVPVEPPKFSVKSGFYDTDFLLEIQAEESKRIYYTLDGSIPTTDSILYEEPVTVSNPSANENVWNSVTNVVSDWKEYTPDTTPVEKAFIIRAIAVDENGNSSQSVTGTYFVGLSEYQYKNVISLIAEPNDLFGEDGIYVTGKEYDKWYENGEKGDAPVENFYKGGRDYEVDANVELFQNGVSTVEQNVGIRIQGGSTRSGAKKRFSVFSRKEYNGSSVFETEIFPDKESHSMVLRSSFGNAFCQSLMEDRAVAIQHSVPATLFLNGEYWYDTYMQERYDDNYIAETFGVNKDNVIVIQNGLLDEGKEEDITFYGDIYKYYSTHDFTTEEAYYGFSEVIDMQSYIDFLCANIYFCNMDFSETKNCIIWRVRETGNGTYSDGKWRWMLYDMDSIEWNSVHHEFYEVNSTAEIDSFSQKMYTVGASVDSQGIFITLKQNPLFCKQFVLSFMDLINTNFSAEVVAEKIKNWGEDISWLDGFFQKRAEYIVPDMAEQFNLKGTLEISISDANAGTIRVNTVKPELSDGKWEGQYYTDYPVTLEAVTAPGYRFVGWKGDYVSTESIVEIPIQEGGVHIQAIFEKIGDDNEK